MPEEFVDFEEADRPDVLRLLRNQPYKESLWEWQYLRNPAATVSNPLILLKIDGALAGFNGTMPVRLRVDGERTHGIWSCDTFIDDAWRGKGLGSKLFAAVERKSTIVLGYGISDMAYPLLVDKRGWLPSDDVGIFFFQRHARSARDLAKMARQWRALVAPRGGDRWTVETLPASAMPRDVDALWASVEAGYARTVIRDHAYLDWKYGQHPSQAYTIVTLRHQGVLEGLGVLRTTPKESRLVDYVGPREARDLKRRLLRAFADASGDAAVLNVSTSDRELQEVLLEAGYARYHATERFAVHIREPLTDPAKGWFIMRGDSDGDLLDACKA